MALVRAPWRRRAVEEDQGEPAQAPGFAQRALLRRRIRFLRRRRQVALHDLGGFVYESRRVGRTGAEVVEAKLRSLAALDRELGMLERALGVGEELLVLREPGIASCPNCATIHDSLANYCPGCGRPLDARGGELAQLPR